MDFKNIILGRLKIYKMKASIIGYGEWGKKIINTLNLLGNIELKYICKRNKYQSIQNNYNFVYDYRSAITNDLNFVIICTLPDLNFEIAKYALNKKIHVFIEKPVCLRNEDYLYLYNLSLKNNLCLHTNYIHLYNKNFNCFIEKFKSEFNTNYEAEIHLGSSMKERKYLDLYFDWMPHILSFLNAVETNFDYDISNFNVIKFDKKKIYKLKLIINGNTYSISFGNGFDKKKTMFKIISNNKSLEYCDNFTKFNGEIISNNQEPTPLYNSLEAFCANIEKQNTYNLFDKITEIMNDINLKTFNC